MNIKAALLAELVTRYLPAGTDPAKLTEDEYRAILAAMELDAMMHGFTGKDPLNCARCRQLAGPDFLNAGKVYVARVCRHCTYIEIRNLPLRSPHAVS